MEKIKNFLRNFILTKKVYCMISEKRYNKKLRTKLQKNGVKTIGEIQKLLEESGVFFYFDFGTLLGIVREGRLLGHDMDIDVGVFCENPTQKEELKEFLLSKGCSLRYSFSIDEIGVVEDSFVLNDIKFDINYFTKEGENDIGYVMYNNPENPRKQGEMDVAKLTSPHITELKKIDFNGIKINIPAEPEKYLEVRYGKNWRIPDKGYIYWKGPSTSPTDYTGKVFVAELYYMKSKPPVQLVLVSSGAARQKESYYCNIPKNSYSFIRLNRKQHLLR